MGNRHAESEPILIINPPEYPFLHIMRMQGDNGLHWEFVPHLSGMKLQIGTKIVDKAGQIGIISLADFDIPLLPPITTVPPAPIDTRVVVERALTNRKDEFIQALRDNSNADTLAFSHGYGWGFYPVRIVAQILEGRYRVDTNGVFQIGGRKKFQVNAVGIQRI